MSGFLERRFTAQDGLSLYYREYSDPLAPATPELDPAPGGRRTEQGADHRARDGRRQQQHVHDAFTVHGVAFFADADPAGVGFGQIDELGRGPGMQSEAVDQSDLRRFHCRSSSRCRTSTVS